MKFERRNYYRILYVQPEAPPEIIEAAYRCLMSKLRHHPDLGGDHDEAVAINRAYATLSDPALRKAYDQLWRRRRQASAETAAPQPAAAPMAPPPEHLCAFCKAPMPQIITPDTRCMRCSAPLAPVRAPESPVPEGQRGATRVDKATPAALHLSMDRPASRARLRDVSATGISLFTAAPVRSGDIIRVVTADIDVVARVVRVRPREPICIVHAQLLTAWVRQHAGLLVSVMA